MLESDFEFFAEIHRRKCKFFKHSSGVAV